MVMEMIAGMASTSGPTLTSWVPQDDLLLKNAIEAGASLEALAKGAVRFSRKYNINELRHRWKSLLYDPDVSVEASASMFSLELSATDSPIKTSRFWAKSNVVQCPLKRKLRTIRSQYNATRKKICRQVLDSLDGVMDGMHSQEFNKEYGGSLQQNELCEDMNQIHGDNLVDCKDCSDIKEIGKSHARPDMPIWMRVDGVSTMPHHDNLRNKVQIAKDTFIHPDELDGRDFVNLPESRIDLPNEEELLYMDVDGKDAIEKSCEDNLDSLLLSSPGDQEDNEPNIHQPPNLDSRDNIASSSSCVPTATVDAVTDLSDPGHGDILNSVSHPDMKIQSFEAAKNLCASELNDEYMFCTLNSEDTEIPCNDNIYPLSGTAAIYREASPLLLMSTNQQNNEPEASVKEEDRTTWSFMASQICRSDAKPNVPPIGSISAGAKTAILDRKHLMSMLRQGNNSLANQSQSRLADANLETSSDGPAQQEEIGPIATARELTKLEIGKCDTPHLEASSSSLEPECSDSDDDVPYFDEVEAMILEMDLCPMDEDSHATGEVSRYQHLDSKRTIMRLEQCGQSYIKRATASQGALAVLYGHHMKQYIKKSEVILGRATEDIDVDIDLRREGPANKVSRKQVNGFLGYGRHAKFNMALIKMEGNGSFLLKNLGKSSIFLNGNEVGPGQLLGLCSGSLIEIRDMAFIFEINNKSVRKFLQNEAKRE